MKFTITIDIGDVLKKPVDDWNETDEEALKSADNVVKLPPEESQVDNLPNAKPLIHIVKKGETLKSISEKYGISYGELSNFLQEKEGTAVIYAGEKIEIPRHFVDLSKT